MYSEIVGEICVILTKSLDNKCLRFLSYWKSEIFCFLQIFIKSPPSLAKVSRKQLSFLELKTKHDIKKIDMDEKLFRIYQGIRVNCFRISYHFGKRIFWRMLRKLTKSQTQEFYSTLNSFLKFLATNYVKTPVNHQQ